MSLIPLLLPLNVWDSFLGGLNAMMQPLYWAVSAILVGAHWLLSHVMNPDSGVTWALSIVSLTVVIRTLLIPLFVRQIQSSRNMQLLGPKQKELQEKYGHDRERLGQETMKLYKEEGVNPAASCMPIVLQMPIFIALYTVLSSAARGQPIGIFTAGDSRLSSLQHAQLFGAEISATFLPMTNGFGSTQILTAVLVVAMTVVLFITQLQLMRKNMPPEAMTGQMAQQQKMMLYIFPVMYLFMGVSIPVGVLIYWLTSNIWTMVQQYILIHNNPAPNTPAYVDWEERMRAKGLDPDVVAARRAGKGRKKRPAAPADPTKVARQNSGRPAPHEPDSKRSSGSTKATSGNDARSAKADSGSPGGSTADRQVIRRQQPQRQSRANRKQARPKPTPSEEG